MNAAMPTPGIAYHANRSTSWKGRKKRYIQTVLGARSDECTDRMKLTLTVFSRSESNLSLRQCWVRHVEATTHRMWTEYTLQVVSAIGSDR